jgi:hypothetical protein
VNIPIRYIPFLYLHKMFSYEESKIDCFIILDEVGSNGGYINEKEHLKDVKLTCGLATRFLRLSFYSIK